MKAFGQCCLIGTIIVVVLATRGCESSPPNADAVVRTLCGSVQGTGFVVGRDGPHCLVLTCDHCVPEVFPQIQFFRNGTLVCDTGGGVIFRDRDKDLALIHVLHFEGFTFPEPVKIARHVPPSGGNAKIVHCAGCVAPTVQQGKFKPGDTFIHLDPYIGPGSSGSPVFNEAGEVVSLLFGNHTDPSTYHRQHLGVHAEQLRAFIFK